jgi:hypothetical protein
MIGTEVRLTTSEPAHILIALTGPLLSSRVDLVVSVAVVACRAWG